MKNSALSRALAQNVFNKTAKLSQSEQAKSGHATHSQALAKPMPRSPVIPESAASGLPGPAAEGAKHAIVLGFVLGASVQRAKLP